MRTSTFKKIGIVLLIVLGLILSGCDTAKAIVPKTGQTELVINFSGTNSPESTTIQVVGNDTVSLNADNVRWFYDIPEDGFEYAAITFDAFGKPRNMYLHLHKSKKPPAKQ